MELISLGLLFVILPISAGIYYCLPKRFKGAGLFAISALIYLLEAPEAFWITFANMVVDYLCIRLMWRYEHHKEPLRWISLGSIAKNVTVVLLLGIALPIHQGSLPWFGITVTGLSAIAYVRSLYKGELVACDSFVTFGVYCMFFGRLRIGPIDPPTKLLPEIRRLNPDIVSFGEGIGYVTLGTAKLVLLVGNLTAFMESISSLPTTEVTILSNFLLLSAQCMRLFFTFSGYSDLGMGLGKVFGLNISRNVYYPLQARGIYEYVCWFQLGTARFINNCLGISDERDWGEKRLITVFLCALLVGVWYSPGYQALAWAILMTALSALELLIPTKVWDDIPAIPLRSVTALLYLPTGALLLGKPVEEAGAIAASLVGIGGYNLYNGHIFYILSRGYTLLIIGALCSTSFFDITARFIKQKFPGSHSLIVSIYSILLMLLTASFMLMEVI